MKANNRIDGKQHKTYIIVGGGPAGLQVGYFLSKQNEDYLILEKSDSVGNFFRIYPRHRNLLSINKYYTGYTDQDSRLRYDWNSLLNDGSLLFTDYTKEYYPNADYFVRYLKDFAQKFNIAIHYNTQVVRVSKKGGQFRLECDNRALYTCDRLIVTTGVVPHVPDIPGVELCEKYEDFSTDPERFIDKRVLIVGKGNSSFETAEKLIPVTRKIQMCSPNHVTLAWTSHFVGDIRAVNNNFLDTYLLKAQNNILDGELRKVERTPQSTLIAHIYFASRRQVITFEHDYIILCTGFRFDGSIFDKSCHVELAHGRKLPAMTSEWESTTAQDLYFAGILMQSRDYKKTMSSFTHGYRHNIAALVNMFDCKYHDKEWRDSTKLPIDSGQIAKKIIERVSTAPGIFLQPGFLGDVLVISEEKNEAILYEDVPVDYIHESPYGENEHYYVITLEYGDTEGLDPFSYPRGTGVPEDFYPHPIIQKYHKSEATDRFCLPDDLDNDWRQENHVESVENFLQKSIEASRGEKS